jgi:flagellar biosynthetic protein FlhB
MADQDLDQTENATPHKLSEARKKGAVAKSQDFVSMAMLAAACVVLFAQGRAMLEQVLRLQHRLLAHPLAGAWTVDGVSRWGGEILRAMLDLMAPACLALLVVAIVANLFQTGPVFSFHPLSPDLTKLNPANGIKRLFSLRTLVDTGKSLLKLVLLCGVLVTVLKGALPGLVGLPLADPRHYPMLLLDLGGSLLVKLVAVLLVVALLDLLYVRWEFGKRMRMSKREVKDEHKNREGDPRIRARIRDLRKEMLKRSQSLGKVPSADVLVTNPTHLAVAISYRHGTSVAPQVVAKGAGETARAMRKLAGRHHIPIVQNRALARALYREVDYDGYVPEKLYPQVAKIMVWVYAMRRNRR